MLTLRGHHLLCLHGFRGLGYSPEFAANMTLIRDRLVSTPETPVAVVDSPDDICSACPHLVDTACSSSGPDSEVRIAAKDRTVIQAIGIETGRSLPASELLARVRRAFVDGLPSICDSCEWRPLGYCSEGIAHGLCADPTEPDAP